MRIKHKREYVIFRRTKMATAHRKCDECEFWFQSAKTYHQHRSQLPNQLPGENKGSECDAYVRIAKQFTSAELGDMTNFVQGLFKFYLESKYQDKPAQRKKLNPQALSALSQLQNTLNGSTDLSDLSSSSLSDVLTLLTNSSSSSSAGVSSNNNIMMQGQGNPVTIEREPGFKATPIPSDQNELIECPVFDCDLKIKFSSLNIHFSRKHPGKSHF